MKSCDVCRHPGNAQHYEASICKAPNPEPNVEILPAAREGAPGPLTHALHHLLALLLRRRDVNRGRLRQKKLPTEKTHHHDHHNNNDGHHCRADLIFHAFTPFPA